MTCNIVKYIEFHKESMLKFIFQVGCGCLIILLALYRVGEKVGIYFGDEFGYFSVAGFLVGFDWSEQVSHLGYYGIGYGLFLVPAFLLCKSVHQLMTYAVVLNCFFLILSYVLCLKLLKKIWFSKSDYVLSMIAVFAITYVSNLCHIQMGWSETLNVFLYWFCLYSAYKMYLTQKKRYYILFMSILCFSVMVHMRNIMLAIAGMLVVLLLWNKKKKIDICKIVSMALVLCCGIIIFFVTKSFIKENLYLNSLSSSNNDISAAISGFASIFSKQNFFKDMLNSLFGKSFYIISATGGVILFGLYHVFKKVWTVKREEELAVYLLSVMAFIFSFLLTVYNAAYGVRMDALFYARYYEHTIGFLLVMGLMFIIESHLKVKLILLEIFVLVYKVLTILVMEIFTDLLNIAQENGFVTLCAVGVSKYWYEKDFSNTVANVFIDTIIVFGGIAIIIIYHYYLSKRIKKKMDFLLIVVLMLIISKNWIKISCLINDSTIADTRGRYDQVNPIAEIIGVNWNEDFQENIYYYTTDYWNEYMLSCQAAIGKTKVKNIESINEVKTNEKIYIILDKNDKNMTEKMTELEKKDFEMIKETDQFQLYVINQF